MQEEMITNCQKIHGLSLKEFPFNRCDCSFLSFRAEVGVKM